MEKPSKPKGRPIRDLTKENPFGRLTVTELDPIRSARRATRWRAICECGNSVVVAGYNLTRGHTQSCGCLHREVVAKLCRERPPAKGTAGRGLIPRKSS